MKYSAKNRQHNENFINRLYEVIDTGFAPAEIKVDNIMNEFSMADLNRVLQILIEDRITASERIEKLQFDSDVLAEIKRQKNEK